ncbi:MAG: hypothetical protein ACI4SM_04725 [Candidatus Gastranaerophilaceae bacterium]
MTQEDLIFAQYKLYAEQKERFIDRSFTTNKFYTILVLVLVVANFLTANILIAKVAAPLILSVIGVVICWLWWLNMDSYNCLIKIKFSKVIEELEKKLPVQPYNMEYRAISDYRKNKKVFLFSDMQKIFAILMLLIFLITFLYEVIPFFVSTNV